MKKLLALILSFVFIFSLSACGNKVEKENSNSQTETAPAEEKEDFANWKEFVKEYEAWMDDYIEIVKKFKENPNDSAIAAQQQEKLTELSDWANRTGKIQKELENAPEDVINEYKAEVTRILAKLSQMTAPLPNGQN